MSRTTSTTRVSRLVRARRRAVYDAFLDPEMVAAWLPPESMRGVVHAWEPRAGGRIHMTLTYREPEEGPGGKTTRDSDTFRGRVVELVAARRVVWAVEFDSERDDLAGEMRVLWDLADAEGGTTVVCTCEDIPPGIRPEDNEAGTSSSLQNLARLVEREGR